MPGQEPHHPRAVALSAARSRRSHHETERAARVAARAEARWLRSGPHPNAVPRSLLRRQPRQGTGRAGDRDLSHVLRRVSASLRAAGPAIGDALRRAPLHRFAMFRARCAGGAVAGHADRRWKTTACVVPCTSFPPAWRWSASRAATAAAFASVSAFAPIGRRWFTSVASRTKRTSTSCCECSFAW